MPYAVWLRQHQRGGSLKFKVTGTWTQSWSGDVVGVGVLMFEEMGHHFEWIKH